MNRLHSTHDTKTATLTVNAQNLSNGNNLPVVVTNAVSGITTSGGVLSGSVTSDGGAVVTERGFVYSTSAIPTAATGIKALSGNGTGTFTITLTGLVSNTTYYVRAYAINSKGIAYGEVRSFKTAIDDKLEEIPNTGDSSAKGIGWVLLGCSAVAIAVRVVFKRNKLYRK